MVIFDKFAQFYVVPWERICQSLLYHSEKSPHLLPSGAFLYFPAVSLRGSKGAPFRILLESRVPGLKSQES